MDVDILILAGGLGTRITGVLGDTPKILAPVGDETFLDFTIDWLAAAGAKRLILCLGHGSQKVLTHLRSRPDDGINIETVVEDEPLGTAGALRLARPFIVSETVLVINGDSWVDVELGDFIASHRESGANVSVLCVGVANTSRYGSCEVDKYDRIARYVEKDPSRTGPGLINAGIYLFSGSALSLLMESQGSSLEYDFLQRLPGGTVHGYVASDAHFIDIGTPESLEVATEMLTRTDQNKKGIQ